MSEALPEGVSRQEFSELAAGMNELREAVEELRQAATPAERAEARSEVRDAKADLAATARELGLDPKRLEKAASEAKASDERARLKEILTELLDEELAEPVEELGDLKPEPRQQREPKPEPDSAPSADHWSDRPLSSLFGGDK